jgi:hypothetical protein
LSPKVFNSIKVHSCQRIGSIVHHACNISFSSSVWISAVACLCIYASYYLVKSPFKALVPAYIREIISPLFAQTRIMGCISKKACAKHM